MMPPAGEQDLGQRILSSLYLQDAVPRRRLDSLGVPATQLEAALRGLREEGLLGFDAKRVRLTQLGAKVAYRLTVSEPHPLEALLAELGSDLPPGGRLLDLGCGPGAYLSDAAGSRGPVVVGLDRDEESLHLASRSLLRAGHGARLVRADAERLPFAGGAFETILCVMVLPYVRENLALDEAARVLGPGGRLIITAHGPGYYLEILLARGATFKRRLFGAVSLVGTLTARFAGLRLPGARYQSARRISRMLRGHGLRTVRSIRSGSRLGFPVSLRLVAEKEGRPA